MLPPLGSHTEAGLQAKCPQRDMGSDVQGEPWCQTSSAGPTRGQRVACAERTRGGVTERQRGSEGTHSWLSDRRTARYTRPKDHLPISVRFLNSPRRPPTVAATMFVVGAAGGSQIEWVEHAHTARETAWWLGTGHVLSCQGAGTRQSRRFH
jgi:hypothetical protein